MTEDDLIARFFAPLAGPGGLGLRDDAACITPPTGHDLVITVDALVAGVHFFPDDPPGSIAIKALGVNLSDLAAKGASPLGFVLTLALPANWSDEWMQGFATGLATASNTANCPLLGGDTVKTPGPLTLSITAFGSVPRARMVARTTARAGDLIVVSGTIGDAALGLQLRLEPNGGWQSALAPEHAAALHERYLHPQPRLALAEPLRDFARAAMDVSDGLIGDCAKMLRASGVSGVLRLDDVPLSDAARRVCLAPETFHAAAFETAMTGGDDYEILLTLDPEHWAAFDAAAIRAGVPVTVIGEATAGTQPLRTLFHGQPFLAKKGAFSHF